MDVPTVSGVAPWPVTPARWLDTFLRTPLLTKLVATDIVVNVLVFVGMQRTPPELAQEVTVVSLVVVLVLNAALVALALRPLRAIEETARRVSRGDHAARTPNLPLADRNLVRIARTLDTLLDTVEGERARVRSLAAKVVATGDAERAHVARELHDGTAQALSALDMLLATTAGEDPARLASRIATMREVVQEALADVRSLCRTMHPRVLDDVGLAAALEVLVHRVSSQSDVSVSLECEVDVPPAPAVARVLYRIAQESVHNALRHARPSHVRIVAMCDAKAARLRVEDDGVGFDPAEVAARRPGGMGLFTMEERAALVDGRCTVQTRQGAGTVVSIDVPVSEAA
jgi:signal transduction histidine kinase